MKAKHPTKHNKQSISSKIATNLQIIRRSLTCWPLRLLMDIIVVLLSLHLIAGFVLLVIELTCVFQVIFG